MQKYIDKVRDHIIGICDMIRGEEGLGGPEDLRVAVSFFPLSPIRYTVIARCDRQFNSDP